MQKALNSGGFFLKVNIMRIDPKDPKDPNQNPPPDDVGGDGPVKP